MSSLFLTRTISPRQSRGLPFQEPPSTGLMTFGFPNSQRRRGAPQDSIPESSQVSRHPSPSFLKRIEGLLALSWGGCFSLNLTSLLPLLLPSPIGIGPWSFPFSIPPSPFFLPPFSLNGYLGPEFVEQVLEVAAVCGVLGFEGRRLEVFCVENEEGMPR